MNETWYEEETPAVSRSRGRYALFALLVVVVTSVVACLYAVHLTTAPQTFPVARPIEITPGSSVADITHTMYEAGVVRSDLALYVILLTQYEPQDLKASTYIFSEPLDAFAVAKRLTEGDFGNDLVRLTHREGERVTALASSTKAVLPDFDTARFITLATPLEGYLFPDTYLIPKTTTPEELIEILQAEYERLMSPRRALIASSTLTEAEVIILASILEREANSPESMKIVAGILENRMAAGMPLQLDASIEYDLDKPLSELTAEDLKIDSPYNTYTNVGLPPTPIGNPGIVAIDAIITPTPSDYFFYITGDNGEFYYATTFDGHRANIARYLR
jgi:UPF0755 protein